MLTSVSYSGQKHKIESFSPFTICTKQIHIVSSKRQQLFQKVPKKRNGKGLQEENINNIDDPFI